MVVVEVINRQVVGGWVSEANPMVWFLSPYVLFYFLQPLTIVYQIFLPSPPLSVHPLPLQVDHQSYLYELRLPIVPTNFVEPVTLAAQVKRRSGGIMEAGDNLR